jgi:hypothetical protein
LETDCHPGGKKDDNIITDNKYENRSKAAYEFGDKRATPRVEPEVGSGVIGNDES